MRTPLLLSSLVTLIGSCALFAGERVQRIETPNGGMVPEAEIDRHGVIHLAYVSGEDVYYVRSSDQGKTFSNPLRVNSEPGTAHPANMFRGPDLALGKDGRIHAIWYSNAYQRKLPHDQWGVMYAHLNEANTAFVPARNLNHKPSDNYSLAADEGGRVAVFWMAGGLFLSLSQNGGDTFAGAVHVAAADTCECCASRAFISGDGALLCAYRDKANNIRDMYLLSEPKGQSSFQKTKLSVTPWEVKGCPMTGTFLTGVKDRLLTAWETKGDVFFSRFDKTGRRLSAGEIQAPVHGGKWPIVFAAPDGTVLISWKKGTTLEWQLYDANDKPLGEKQSAPGRNPHRHAGVVTANGIFLIID